ncbi:MRC1-like domain-containing protein [Aspergillus granulosus]|uniref:MRC1-like domain-containing protein n=1 Tax=Aspergillus granulosus TaxID=176169 RepID=A0ABR4H4Y3_9EURO
MSTPSTPRTARSASVAADSPDILTPGRKIKAMLAAFDSDSESDNDESAVRKPDVNFLESLKANPIPTHDDPMTLDSGSDNDEEDDDIVIPRGRMAACLQGHSTEKNEETLQDTPATETAFERVSKILAAGKQTMDETRRGPSDDEDDDLPAAGPRSGIQNVEAVRDEVDEDSDSARSRSRARSFSPLFVSSPTKQAEGESSGSEEAEPNRNSRFLALVAKKRKEREEKERIEEEKKAAKAKEREISNADLFSEDEDADDGASGKKKSRQQARPGRKASKKALEEMHRETQRMSRNMQLTHEARTKKKITKESFFARFNFMQPQEQTVPEQAAENSSTTADSQHSSDAEAQKDKDTPHTSPVLPPTDRPDLSKDEEMNFPTMEEILSDPTGDILKSIGEAEETTKPAEMSEVKKGKLPIRVAPARVRLTREQVAQHQKDDSDDDLEIVTSPAKCRRIAAFENLPARQVQESASMFKLKVLAQLTSPTRKSTMNSAELSANLLHQAKQQAAKERQERIEELRAKGVVIETAAERAAFEDEVENLVEKARQEGEEIAKKEREAAKRKNNGDQDDDDDDSDFELSGSEDEDGVVDQDEEGEEEEVDEAKAERNGDLVDSEADEDEDDEDDADADVDSEMEEAVEPVEEPEVPTQRRKRPTRVVSDDEDEDEVQAPKTPAKPINPFFNSVERPNIPVKASEATMSLTQAFAGTLAPSQDMSQHDATIPQSLPEPVPMDVRQESDSQVVIKDSQENRAGSADLFGGYWQQDRVSESPIPRSMSQMSQIPDPTQDAGFVLSPFDPNKRFLGTPTSTIETVLVEQNYSPVAARSLRNLKRGKAPALSAVEEQEESEPENVESAFVMMKKAAKKAKKPIEEFDRKKSKARDVVEEAAEESDDEYAGLGGASDDDADDEENAYDREMINDNSGERVDAKQLAALNALHQRNADEKDVAKLLKDITTGALRRRRGNDDEFDLDDSDDEILARRRQKQREFARMRNALLADGKIGEIAENPKKAAFFKAIEDRDDEDDVGFDFLGYEQESSIQDDPSSQDATTEAQSNNAQNESNKRKRPLESAAEEVNNRPPPHLRRKPASAMSKKPATLAEIRETLSFLTERPEYDSFQEDASVNEEEDEQQANNGDGDDDNETEEAEEQLMPTRQREPSVTRSNPRRTRGPVVDRLALLRQASSNSATSASSNTRFAFHTGSNNDKVGSIGFRPPILRKTSTVSSSSSTSTFDSSRVTKTTGASLTKKGAVNYYTAAREREREKQLRTQHRNRGSNITQLLNNYAGNRLGALGGTGNWD